MALFVDRTHAGQLLAQALDRYAGRDDVIVLGLPRGGIPVAAAVARALHAPLDVLVVRKLGVPGQEELAMGAIASGGVRVLNDVVQLLRIPASVVEDVARLEAAELARREALYRGDRPRPSLLHKTVILVDDGLATGSTMRAAVQAVRHGHPARVIVAVPVGAESSCTELERMSDHVVCLHAPDPFTSVGMWYEDFTQTTDEEVRKLLRDSSD